MGFKKWVVLPYHHPPPPKILRAPPWGSVTQLLPPLSMIEWFIILTFLQHDTTVSALLSALKVFDGIMPAYSSAVMIELYSDQDDDK